MQFSPVNSAELMNDPLFRSLSARPAASDHSPLAKNFGCLELTSRHADKPVKPHLTGIPSVQNMIDESKILGRVASGNANAPDFQIREASEHEFKQNYVKELLRLKATTAPSLPDSELARFTKNVYKVEDPNGTYDTQAGTPQKYVDSENPDANKDLRRNNAHPASSGVGYCQIINPTNLRLMISDKGDIVSSLHADAAQLRNSKDDSARIAADNLDKKTELFETLQKKIRDEIVEFGARDKKNHKDYFDGNGNPTGALYTAFSRSNAQTKLGATGRELSYAMQGLLMDGDIGPKVQAKQLNEDLRDSTGKAAQEYFNNAAQGWQKAAEKWDSLSEHEQKRLITSYISKLDAKALSEQERQLLERRVEELAAGRTKDAPPQVDAGTCDAILKAHDLNKQDPNFMQVLKGTYCTGQDMLQRALPALGQFFNNWGTENGNRMLDHHGANTSAVLSREALRANGIARGVNGDGLIERIIRIQRRPDDYGSRDFESIFKDMSGVNYYSGRKAK